MKKRHAFLHWFIPGWVCSLVACSAEERLLFEDDALGSVYLISQSQGCQLSHESLKEKLTILINSAEKDLAPLKTIFHPTHPFVLENSQPPLLKIQQTATTGWQVSLTESASWLFRFDHDTVMAYEYPQSLKISCE